MRWIVGVMMVVLAAGCVSKSKYAALESQIVEKDQLILKRDEQLERAKKEVERRQEFTNKLTEGFRELGKQLKPLRDQGLVTLEIVDGRPVVALKADILFESGSASLSEEGAGLVGKVADVLSKRTEEDFQVQGHTDNKPIKSKDYPSNWYLGSARAITVVEAMVTNGSVERGQLRRHPAGGRQRHGRGAGVEPANRDRVGPQSG